MLATILKGERAVRTTLAIIETYAQVRAMVRDMEALQTLKDGSVAGRLVTMCHYPMLSYPQARRGYMIYGHIHNNTGDDYWPLIMRRPRMLNAGVDVNNFEPVAFDELLANNNAFQRCHADTAKANPFDLYCAEA